MSEWPKNPLPEKNPEANKDLPEINEIFIKNIASELENFFLTAEEKDTRRLSQAVFYELMLTKNFQIPRDIEIITDAFQKILTYFGANGDSDLKRIILKKKDLNYSGPADYVIPRQEKDATPTISETKPLFPEKKLREIQRNSYGHELRNKPPLGSHDDDLD